MAGRSIGSDDTCDGQSCKKNQSADRKRRQGDRLSLLFLVKKRALDAAAKSVRAAEAIKANPRMSNRAIAEERSGSVNPQYVGHVRHMTHLNVSAIKANPKKSDRAIAEELGVGRATVQRARNSGGSYEPPDDERTGRDGKSYSIRQRVTEDPDISPKLVDEAAATVRRRPPGFQLGQETGADDGLSLTADWSQPPGGPVYGATISEPSSSYENQIAALSTL